MKHLQGWVTRLLILVSLAVASLPVGATEMVCVVGREEKVVPVAKCGMPCCHQQPSKPDCCLKPKKEEAHICPLAGKPCRCEIRITAFHGSANSAPIPTLQPFEQPAVLPETRLELPAPVIAALEPGIVGIDSGPPRKLPRSPKQSRAPPVSL